MKKINTTRRNQKSTKGKPGTQRKKQIERKPKRALHRTVAETKEGRGPKAEIRPASLVKPAAMLATQPAVETVVKSLPRLREILGENYQPVVDYEAIRNRVPFKPLTRRINEEWHLAGDNRFQDGEINAATVVIDLAREIDSRAGL